MRIGWIGLMAFVWAGVIHAEIVTQTIKYPIAGKSYVGYLAYDDSIKEPRPGIVVFHEWWGLNDFARSKAEALAALGYVAFAADMYGKGMATHDPEQAGQWYTEVSENRAFRKRAQAAVNVLKKQAGVDPKRIGAIGFCFGGTTVLELAYSGADVQGVVSFHGGLTAPGEADRDQIQSAILVLHGAQDPFVKPEQLEAFESGLKASSADWQLVIYGNTLHSFTNPKADSVDMEGLAYNPLSDRRSWAAMQQFFDEVLR